MNFALIAFSRDGAALLNLLCRELSRQGDAVTGFLPEKFRDPAHDAVNVNTLNVPVRDWAGSWFTRADGLIFVGAAGIAVRSIAPYIRDKYTDPAVVVVDDGANFAIPLLSGHVGKANELARRVADIIGARPVITTSSDVRGIFALDEWARALSLLVSDPGLAKEMASVVLDGGTPGFLEDEVCEGYCAYKAGIAHVPEKPDHCEKAEDNDHIICVTPRRYTSFTGKVLRLIPPCVAVGVGCRKGVEAKTITAVIKHVLERENIDRDAVFCVASVDLKNREQGLISAAASLGVPFVTFPSAFLDAIPGNFSESEFVREVTGTGNICERAAYAAALRKEDHRGAKLLSGKYSENGVTVALAAPVYREAHS